MGTQEIFGILEVKGDATLASVSDREIPACAAFRACRGGRGEGGGGGRRGEGGCIKKEVRYRKELGSGKKGIMKR